MGSGRLVHGSSDCKRPSKSHLRRDTEFIAVVHHLYDGYAGYSFHWWRQEGFGALNAAKRDCNVRKSSLPPFEIVT
jgi:hypothetical protein